MGFLTGIPTKMLAYASAAAAACMALLAAFSGVRRIGRQDAENAVLRKTVNDTGTARDVQNAVAATADDAVARQLRERWTRG